MQQVIMPLCIFKIAKMSKPMKKILSSVKNFLQEYEDLGIEEIYSLRETNKNESEATNISLELLKKEGLKCQNCQLAQTRKNVVFGLGNQKAKLMIIGEGPGANEDAQGLPFVGRAGDLLTKMLLAIKIEREDVYITNIVKCRPPQNRDPKPEEVKACIHFLKKQIELIKPKVLLLLGRVAGNTFFELNETMGNLREKKFEL
eukprot:TRINITY_DN21944_c0_g1_i1.p1 TRINITY_DN21944_c0_g1~~TRINITY_DN21944_c0_g1_i1.p1  ORF type:complete len:202 (-),score=35.48 TRINITY_DN21944_c0_g1_i1:117-722(-)